MAAGYLGRHNHDDKLKVGEVQTMVFRETDKGPFHWSEKDREDNKYDDFGDWDWVDLTCDELREKLEAKNVDSRGVKKTIQRRCTNSGISIRKRVQKLKTLGWVGKPKGVFQILWERGFIDPMRINDYTMNGSIDKSTGLRDNELSLNYLIRQCVDFLHEKTLLQYNGEALGCIVDRSPKCTPEIAGDGIEFDWAMAKLWFRMQRVEKRKKKQDFVNTALSDKVVSLEQSRKFSRRARENMYAYYKLTLDGTEKVTPTELERFKAEGKTHRCTMDDCKGEMSHEARLKHIPT